MSCHQIIVFRNTHLMQTTWVKLHTGGLSKTRTSFSSSSSCRTAKKCTLPSLSAILLIWWGMKVRTQSWVTLRRKISQSISQLMMIQSLGFYLTFYYRSNLPRKVLKALIKSCKQSSSTHGGLLRSVQIKPSTKSARQLETWNLISKKRAILWITALNCRVICTSLKHLKKCPTWLGILTQH